MKKLLPDGTWVEVPAFVKDDLVTARDRPGQQGIVLGIAEPPMMVNPGYMGAHWNPATYWVRFGERRLRYSEGFLSLWVPPDPPALPPVPLRQPPSCGTKVRTSRGWGTVSRPLGLSTGWPPGSAIVEVDPCLIRFRGETIDRGGPMYCTPEEMEIR